LARIAENQTLFGEAQNQMIVPTGREGGWAGRHASEFAGHAQVDSHPGLFGKAKEHLFAVRLRIQQPGAGESLAEDRRVAPPKNPFPGVKVDGDDLLLASRIPLFAKKFNFGQFRHVASLIPRAASDNPCRLFRVMRQ
jgi:hypothetical protein